MTVAAGSRRFRPTKIQYLCENNRQLGGNYKQLRSLHGLAPSDKRQALRWRQLLKGGRALGSPDVEISHLKTLSRTTGTMATKMWLASSSTSVP